MELKKKLGKRIQELRKNCGYTQAQLAELVGIATKSQSCIETGKNYPSAELIEKYAKVFGIEDDDVFEFANSKDTELLKQEIASMIKNADSNKILTIHKLLKGLLF